MTEMEKDALVLFKDYTHLQLKSFDVHSKTNGAGGAVEPYEIIVIGQALEYHRIYLNKKLNGESKKRRSS